MGNKSKNTQGTLPTMGEDVTGTQFSAEGRAIPREEGDIFVDANEVDVEGGMVDMIYTDEDFELTTPDLMTWANSPDFSDNDKQVAQKILDARTNHLIEDDENDDFEKVNKLMEIDTQRILPNDVLQEMHQKYDQLSLNVRDNDPNRSAILNIYDKLESELYMRQFLEQ